MKIQYVTITEESLANRKPITSCLQEACGGREVLLGAYSTWIGNDEYYNTCAFDRLLTDEDFDLQLPVTLILNNSYMYIDVYRGYEYR